MRRLNSILIVATLTALGGGFAVGVRAQDGGNTFGAGAQQPNAEAPGSETIYFFALDSDGKAITDLKAEELEVRVHGAPVKIARLFPPGAEPPLTLQVLLDVSGSRREHLPGVEQKYAYDFFEALLRPGDRAFVWEFNDEPYLLTSPQDSIDPKALAARVAREWQGGGSTALFDAIFQACRIDTPNGGGRMAVLAVSDGEDNSSRHRVGDVADVLQRNNIQFFVINVGRATPDVRTQHHLTAPDVKVATWELETARKVFRSLAESAAGGFVEEVATEKDFQETLDHVVLYLRNEYSVTFTVPADVPKRKVRQFSVGATRPGVTIVGPREIRELQ